MRFFAIVTLAVSATMVYGFCGNEVSDERRKAMDAEFEKARIQLPPRNESQSAYVIDVYWNAIQKGPSLAEGHIPRSQAQDQINVLNQLYAPSLSFNLANFQYVSNPRWFSTASLYADGIAAASEMKGNLRQGGPATLNIYTVGFEQGRAATEGLLGYATFPSDYQTFPRDDGVVLRFTILPGGAIQGYNTGKIAVHELGHWLGLRHTFNEGSFSGTCLGSTDEVNDTPAEASPASGCPEGRDSCPGLPGLDPIHNHMDYSDDRCRTQFTQGQLDRVRAMVATYRGIRI